PRYRGTRFRASSKAWLRVWQAFFDHARLAPGQRVLIHGAAGGVGTFAIQIAHWRGAYVIGTASAKNRDFLLGLGADEVIDHQQSQFEQVVPNSAPRLITPGLSPAVLSHCLVSHRNFYS